MESWLFPSIAFSLPDWVSRSLPKPGHRFACDEEKMKLAIELSRLNVHHATEPCSMCMGCVTWSGVRRLVCGASDQDARSIGFDEGVKAKDWVDQLRSRGIAVQQNVCREQAVSVLNAYKDQGGLIYNARVSTASGGAAP
jgi:hypothetical protein